MVSGAWGKDILTWLSYSFSYLSFFGIGFVSIVWRDRTKRCLEKFWKYINGKIQKRSETKPYMLVESSISLLAFWTVISSCLPSSFCFTNNLLALIKINWSPPQKFKHSQSTSKYLLPWPSIDTGWKFLLLSLWAGKKHKPEYELCQGSWQACIPVFSAKKNKEKNQEVVPRYRAN